MGQNQSAEDPSLTVSPGGTPHMMAPGSHPNTSTLTPSTSGPAMPNNAPVLQQLLPHNRQASAAAQQQQQQQQQLQQQQLLQQQQQQQHAASSSANQPSSAASPNNRTQPPPPNGTTASQQQPPQSSPTAPPPYLHAQQSLSHQQSSPSSDPQPQPSPSPPGPQSLSQQVIDLIHDPTQALPSQSPLLPALTAVAEEAIPTEFKWVHGGEDVYVCGSFNSWQGKIQMGKEVDGDFHLILSLAPGQHMIRYVVDGRWDVDKDGNVVVDQLTATPYNIVTVQRPVFEYQLGNYADSDDDDVDERKQRTEYARTAPRVEDYVTNPVKLPPQLTTIILQQQGGEAGEGKAGGAVEAGGVGGQLLPVPAHVVLNHAYLLPSVDRELLITGITQRFKPNSHTKITHKFVTTVFYQPKPTQDELQAGGAGGGGGGGMGNGPAVGATGGLPYAYYEGGLGNGGMMGGMMSG